MTFKKYPDICRLGHEDNKDILNYQEDTIVIEEKADGSNFSFWQEKDRIHFGSRNRDLTLENDIKMFAGFQIWLREHLEKLEKDGIKINPDYIYYVECMATHTIKYNNPPLFIGIEIRIRHDINSNGFGLFLGRDSRVQEFIRLKIPNIPLLWRGKVSDFKKIEISSFICESKIENWDGRLEL